MTEDNTNGDADDNGDSSSDRQEALGGTMQKGFTGDEDGEIGSEGGYGFIRPSAEDSSSEGGSNSDSGSE
ncbi:hypothetical protein [Halorubrum sp. DM2]|uniref:hypothetical protein n=1 Tax=Halorubrum sp. DM2 TaxID=2527867 RepID=UPI0024B70582|nr:hypothetical protein [Halorubrum sp. DM2]